MRVRPDVATARPTPPVRAPALSARSVFAAMTLGTLAITLLRNLYVFTTDVHEDGDFALNSLLVNHTQHGLQLVGNYSRVGFDHPGPAYIYVLSAGQSLFHDLLHIVPSQYDGQALADMILQSALLGLTVMSIYRVTRSVVALATSASIIFAYSATHQLLGYVWLPNMYMTAFALFIVAATALAAGHTRELPLVAIAAGLLVHGHIAFIVFVGASVLLAAAGWRNCHGRTWRSELAGGRRWLRQALAIIAVFAAPMILEVGLHYPGPWKQYVDYSTKRASAPHTLAESAGFFGHFWSQSWPAWLMIGAGAIGLLTLAVDRDPRRRRYFGAGYLILGLETLLFCYYITNGIDNLDAINYYTGYFYETVPMFVVVFAFTQTALVAHERIRARSSDWARLVVPGIAGLAAIELVVAASFSPVLANPYRGSDDYPAIVAALQHDPDRGGRPIELFLTQDDWVTAAGTFIEATRRGQSICLDDPYWTLLFTSRSMCGDATGDWQVGIEARSHWSGQGSVIWSNSAVVVFEGTIQRMPPR